MVLNVCGLGVGVLIGLQDSNGNSLKSPKQGRLHTLNTLGLGCRGLGYLGFWGLGFWGLGFKGLEFGVQEIPCRLP